MHKLLSPGVARQRAVALACAVAGLALIVPQPASAKTFVSTIADASGDAANGSTDITRARVAYNRKSGAISVSVTMKDDIDAANDDAVVTVIFSDLKNGKCQRATMSASVVLSMPGISFGALGEGALRRGTSSMDGDTVSFRVKHKSFSGRTPGCTYVATFTNQTSPTQLDETKGNDGFR